MAVVIDASVGGAASNAFATLAEATTYMEARLNANLWDAASTDSQNRALVEATRELSALSWAGRRSTETQALAWPRWDAPNPDSPNGFLYNSDVVPQRVKDATCELALQFINAGTTDIASVDPKLAVIREKIDVLETEYAEPYQRAQGLKRFPSVWRFIAPLVASTSSGLTVVRG